MGRAVVAGTATRCVRRRPRAPRAAEPGPRADATLREPIEVGRAGEPIRRVLLVEDDAALASVLARHLAARGHEVRLAPCAGDVTTILRSGFVPTVVVVDVDIPDGEGWDLLVDGRLGPSAASRIVTASAGVRGSRLRQFDIDWFVLKPFALSVLVEIVEGGQPADGATRPSGTGAAGAQAARSRA